MESCFVGGRLCGAAIFDLLPVAVGVGIVEDIALLTVLVEEGGVEVVRMGAVDGVLILEEALVGETIRDAVAVVWEVADTLLLFVAVEEFLPVVVVLLVVVVPVVDLEGIPDAEVVVFDLDGILEVEVTLGGFKAEVFVLGAGMDDCFATTLEEVAVDVNDLVELFTVVEAVVEGVVVFFFGIEVVVFVVTAEEVVLDGITFLVEAVLPATVAVVLLPLAVGLGIDVDGLLEGGFPFEDEVVVVLVLVVADIGFLLEGVGIVDLIGTDFDVVLVVIVVVVDDFFTAGVGSLLGLSFFPLVGIEDVGAEILFGFVCLASVSSL